MTIKPLKSGGILRYVLFTATVLVALTGLRGGYITAGEDLPPSVLFKEEFDSLGQWEPLKFNKVERMCSYTLDRQSEKDCYVKAASDNSASGMVWKGEFNVYDHPMVRWRWKVSNIYNRGNALEKKGDDYPMRIYVMFKYDTTDPNVRKKLKYSLGKLLYGKYPPYASLNYIWANREHHREYIPSPYAREAVMIPVRSGPALTGRWLTEERNILEDYRKAFGTDPPAVAGLAFMNDSDNTGGSSESWLDWIEIYKGREGRKGKEEEGR